MNLEGIVVDEFTFPNDYTGILSLALRLTTMDRVVMEPTGSVWTNLYSLIDERHVPVVLANPLKTRAIASARIKKTGLMRGSSHIYSGVISWPSATCRRGS